MLPPSPRASTCLRTSSPPSTRSATTTATAIPATRCSTTRGVERQRQSVPWGGETPVGRQQAPDAAVPAPGDNPHAGHALHPARPDPWRPCTASAYDSPGANGSRCTPPATPATTCVCTTGVGVLLPATTCCRRSRRTSRASATARPARSIHRQPRSRRGRSTVSRWGFPRTAIRSTTSPRDAAIKRHHLERLERCARSRARSAPQRAGVLAGAVPGKLGPMAESETFAHLEHLGSRAGRPTARTAG